MLEKNKIEPSYIYLIEYTDDFGNTFKKIVSNSFQLNKFYYSDKATNQKQKSTKLQHIIEICSSMDMDNIVDSEFKGRFIRKDLIVIKDKYNVSKRLTDKNIDSFVKKFQFKEDYEIEELFFAIGNFFRLNKKYLKVESKDNIQDSMKEITIIESIELC